MNTLPSPRFIIIAIVVFLASIIIWNKVSGNVKKEEAAVKQDIVKVEAKVFKATPRLKGVALTGETEANRSVVLRAETAGQIQKIQASEGKMLKKDDDILILDDEGKSDVLKEVEALVEQRKLEYQAAEKLSKQSFRSKTSLAVQLTQLRSAEANLARAQTDLDRTKIKAPFDGIVNRIYVEEGDFVRVGEQIASVVELDPVLITAQASEQDIKNIKEGTLARAIISDGTQLDGKITYVSRVADTATRTFRVEMQASNPDFKVQGGLTAELYIAEGQVQAHLITPAILALNDDGVIGVKGLDDENKIVFYPVEILSQEKEGLWIAGIPDEVKLIINGQDFFAVGQTVEVYGE